ncbi:hypothetical protein BS78_08G129200 [Paspalum vaginatum]|nr:hypothetical protein BS78_08G129200 [Paspalum vaginatum]
MCQLFFLFLLLFLPHASFSAPAAGGGGGGVRCKRQCNRLVVPYPFGFSCDCPIPLTCNATASTAFLSPHSTAAEPLPIVSFNSTASTFLVSVDPSCTRNVTEARESLSGAGYDVSSRTGIILRGGGCAKPGGTSNSRCSAPSSILSVLLRSSKCGGNESSWTCAASPPPPPPSSAAALKGQGQFIDWRSVQAAGCENALSATVYGDAAQGVVSLEFGVAELGWWLNGTCANATKCAQKATCRDVETPSGALGHRCACLDGMKGDGFAAGEGCNRGAGECFLRYYLCYRGQSTEDPEGVGKWDQPCHVSRPPKVNRSVKHARASPS